MSSLLKKIWPFSLFQDASVRNGLEAWSAYRHNKEHRNLLLFPIMFWSLSCYGILSLMMGVEVLCHPEPAPAVFMAFLGCSFAWTTIVVVVMTVSWLWLSREDENGERN